jgi:hypothetical protein
MLIFETLYIIRFCHLLYLESKYRKYYLYIASNNIELVDSKLFSKFEFNENIHITPKKKFTELNININVQNDNIVT